MAWYYPRTALLAAIKPVYFHLPCGNIFKLEHAYSKKRGEPLRCWGRFLGWEPFFHLYLSSVVRPQYENGSQPECIKNRADLDLTKVTFHYGRRNTRCRCDSPSGFRNCEAIRKAEREFYIKRLLKG
jgi:hypothetical protein